MTDRQLLYLLKTHIKNIEPAGDSTAITIVLDKQDMNAFNSWWNRPTIDDDTLEYVLTTALEGGIGYWACLCNDRDDFIHREYYGESCLATLKAGHGVWFEDEDGDQHELTLSNLINAIMAFGDIDDSSFDANDADTIIQTAIFGEVIYA